MLRDEVGIAWCLVAGLAIAFAGCIEAQKFTPLPPSVPKLRLPRNDVYKGMFLSEALRPRFVWEASTVNSGTIIYELQYSADPTFVAATATKVTSELNYQLDEALPVSTVPPVGRRYYWRVRACIETYCSNYSRTWWVNLGRSEKDFNGDGYADVVVGAPGEQGRGIVYVYSGGTGPTLNAVPDTIIGESKTGDSFGHSVSSAGDFNADGFADLIVGAPGAADSGPVAGRSYVYLGGPGISLETKADVILSGVPGERAGYSVSSAGDVNADGFSDILVGAAYNSGSGQYAGRVYIYFGGDRGALDTPDGVLSGTTAGELFGRYVFSAGDLNGDGFADVAVTSGPFDDIHRAPCQAHIFSGGAEESFDAFKDLTVNGDAIGDCGFLAVGAGDVNRDGFTDLLGGTLAFSPKRTSLTVYLGNTTLDSTPEMTLTGSAVGETHVTWISSAGDMNADGFDDVVVGGQYASPSLQVKVYLGTGSFARGILATPAAATLTEASNESSYGLSLAKVGDVNGDGYDDIAVGSYNDNVTYVYFGNAGGLIDPNADGILRSSAGHHGWSVACLNTFLSYRSIKAPT